MHLTDCSICILWAVLSFLPKKARLLQCQKDATDSYCAVFLNPLHPFLISLLSTHFLHSFRSSMMSTFVLRYCELSLALLRIFAATRALPFHLKNVADELKRKELLKYSDRTLMQHKAY